MAVGEVLVAELATGNNLAVNIVVVKGDADPSSAESAG